MQLSPGHAMRGLGSRQVELLVFPVVGDEAHISHGITTRSTILSWFAFPSFIAVMP